MSYKFLTVNQQNLNSQKLIDSLLGHPTLITVINRTTIAVFVYDQFCALVDFRSGSLRKAEVKSIKFKILVMTSGYRGLSGPSFRQAN